MFSNPAWEWFKGAFQFILDALQAILDALNPILYILRVLDIFVSILPAPADLSAYYDSFEATMNWLGPIFQLANHFVNLPLWASAVFVILVTETAINVFRAWRMVRSIVT